MLGKGGEVGVKVWNSDLHITHHMFNPSLSYCLCGISEHVLLDFLWVLSRFSSILPVSKNMPVDGSAIADRGKCVIGELTAHTHERGHSPV